MDQPGPTLAWRWYRWNQPGTDPLYQALRLHSEVFVVEQTCIHCIPALANSLGVRKLQGVVGVLSDLET